MGKKRKRPCKTRNSTGASAAPSSGATSSQARLKISKADASQNGSTNTTHPVITLYYRQVLTLRQYLLHQLPASSKQRRRRITSLRAPSSQCSTGSSGQSASALVELLDLTLVGVLKETPAHIDTERCHDFRAFTESQSRSILDSTDTGPTSPQSEVGQSFHQNDPTMSGIRTGIVRS